MNIRNREYLKQQANQLLRSAAYDPKKLTLLHGGVAVGLSLLLSIISIFIQEGISDTGGLSGIQTRNILQTIQALLNLAYSIAQPFWVVGIVFSFIRITRKQNADRDTLLQGFRRFGPVLRLNLLKWGLLILLSIPCAYVSSTIALYLSADLYALLEPIAIEMSQNPNVDMYALIEQLPTGEFLQAILPLLIIFAIMYVTILVVLGYRLRMANYLIVDDPKIGAIAAMKGSFHLTKGNSLSLFLLDLSFWWYYILLVLAALFSFADLLLPYIGISLPISGPWSAIISYCLYGAIVLTLDYTVRPRIEATYATAYHCLRNPNLFILQHN